MRIIEHDSLFNVVRDAQDDKERFDVCVEHNGLSRDEYERVLQDTLGDLGVWGYHDGENIHIWRSSNAPIENLLEVIAHETAHAQGVQGEQEAQFMALVAREAFAMLRSLETSKGRSLQA